MIKIKNKHNYLIIQIKYNYKNMDKILGVTGNAIL